MGGPVMFRQERIIAIGRILFLLTPWAFIAYLSRDVDAVLDAFEDASLAPLAGGLLLTLAGLVGMALLWTRLVGHLSRDVAVPDTPHLMRAFARSWLARYLPGKVWSYGARMIHTDVEVAPRRIVASTLVDEFALIVGSATALGLGLWVWAVAGPAVGVPVLAVGLLVVVVAVSRLDPLAQMALRFLGRVLPQRWRSAGEELQRAADDPGLGLKASALFTGGYMLTNFLLAVAFVLIVWSMSDIAWGDVAYLVAGNSLAGVVGIVAFFAPAGLGVREGVLVGFLAPVVGSPTAAALAVLIRLVTVVTDVAFLALAEGLGLLARGVPRRPMPASTPDNERSVEAPADQSGR